jgi:hypothetical protein
LWSLFTPSYFLNFGIHPQAETFIAAKIFSYGVDASHLNAYPSTVLVEKFTPAIGFRGVLAAGPVA